MSIWVGELAEYMGEVIMHYAGGSGRANALIGLMRCSLVAQNKWNIWNKEDVENHLQN